MILIDRWIFHCNQGTSDKIYLINLYVRENEQPNYLVVTEYGRRTAKTFKQGGVDTFTTKEAALVFMSEISNTKEAKGYNEITHDYFEHINETEVVGIPLLDDRYALDWTNDLVANALVGIGSIVNIDIANATPTPREGFRRLEI